MPKSQKIQLFRLSTLSLIVMAVILAGAGSVTLGYAFSVGLQEGRVLGKSDNRGVGKGNSVDKVTGSVNNKDKETPPGLAKAAGNSNGSGKVMATAKIDKTDVIENKGLNAAIHKDKVKKSLEAIDEVADEVYNTEISEEIEDAVEEAEEELDTEETAEAIEEIESRPKWKSLLLGADYKNLGQLRSAIVRNRNTVRNLNRVKTKVAGTEAELRIQEQVSTLEQEQERLQAIIEDNEDTFGILGWVRKMLFGATTEEESAEAPEDTNLEDEDLEANTPEDITEDTEVADETQNTSSGTEESY